jgi:hypothetical protein
MREKLMNVFCVLVLLVGVGALWVVPAVIVFAERYPWSTEEQFLSNLDSCYFLQRVPELEEQRSQLKTFRITVTKTAELDIKAMSEEEANKKAKKHLYRILRKYPSTVSVNVQEQN